MVHALHRASRWVHPGGCVIDIHPTPRPAAIEADGRVVGRVEATDAPARHAAADAAVRDVIDAGVFVAAGACIFDFYTYANTLAELRQHIEENWRDARVVLQQPEVAGRPRAREHVRVAKLIPQPR